MSNTSIPGVVAAVLYLGLCWWIVSSASFNPIQSQIQIQETKRDTYESQHNRGFGKASADQTKGRADNQKSTEIDPRSCHNWNDPDLCAQMRMARAAEDQSDWSKIGLWLLGFTLAATAIAAIATTVTAWIMSSSAKRQLRPYVHCNAFVISRTVQLENQESVKFVNLEIDWQNYGTTPARRALSALNWYIYFDNGTPERFNFRDLHPPSQTAQTLGPQQSYFARTIPIPVNVAVRAWQGRIKIIYWGWIEYDGVEDGVRHRTEICAFLNPKGDPRLVQTNYSNTWVTDFNAADKNCVHEPKT